MNFGQPETIKRLNKNQLSEKLDKLDIAKEITSMKASISSMELKKQEISEAPSTPKKKPIFKQISPQTPPKLKSRYVITQTPSRNIGLILAMWFLFIWITGMIVCESYDKYKEIEKRTLDEKIKCEEDFHKNKCQNPLKGLIQYCSQKKKCMETTLDELMVGKLQISQITGSILKGFVDGAGMWGMAAGFVILILAIVLGRGKVVKKQYVQYSN